MKKTLTSILTASFTTLALAGGIAKADFEYENPQYRVPGTYSQTKNPKDSKVEYSAFKRGLGEERIGDFDEIKADLLRLFWTGARDESLKKSLCSALLNSDENFKNLSEKQKLEYKGFDPEKYAEKSLWKPLRNKNKRISEKDKQLYFIVHINPDLRDNFFKMYSLYLSSLNAKNK